MLLILDSNEYIFALGPNRKLASEKLLEKILEHSELISLRICRLIIDEVRGKLTNETFKEFIVLINKLTPVDEDFIVPFGVAFKYESAGLKPADAFIAAYTEWTGAEVLASENRHFPSRHRDLPFRVLTAEKCLNLIKHLIGMFVPEKFSQRKFLE